MRRLVITFVAAIAVLAASDTSAQTTAAASASIVIPPLLSISVDQLTVTFPQPTLADYTAGEVASTVTSTIGTRGNVGHDVTIVADAATMSYTGSETPPSKPSSDMQWSIDNATWNGLTTTAAAVASAIARGNNPSVAGVTYQMLLDENNDYVGTYSLAFTFTVVAN